MKRQIDLSDDDLKIIIKALSYLCYATHSRPEYLYSERLCKKLKDIQNNNLNEGEEHGSRE